MTFLINLEQAEAIANTFKSKSSEARADLETLSGKVNPDGIFEGNAANKYRQRYEEFKQAQGRLNEALDDLGKSVDWVVQEVRRIEEGY